ncbi:TPA: hypothetical protein SUC36_001826 [Streptococcus equi subsp. equi]|nr:hypothetical protein [Streptococcus equi subsp. equi]
METEKINNVNILRSNNSRLSGYATSASYPLILPIIVEFELYNIKQSETYLFQITATKINDRRQNNHIKDLLSLSSNQTTVTISAERHNTFFPYEGYGTVATKLDFSFNIDSPGDYCIALTLLDSEGSLLDKHSNYYIFGEE